KVEGASNGLDRTSKFNQNAVPHHLHKTAVVMRYRRRQYVMPARLESGKGARLVQLHETTISDNVGHQDGSKAAAHGFDPPVRGNRLLIAVVKSHGAEAEFPVLAQMRSH